MTNSFDVLQWKLRHVSTSFILIDWFKTKDNICTTSNMLLLWDNNSWICITDVVGYFLYCGKCFFNWYWISMTSYVDNVIPAQWERQIHGREDSPVLYWTVCFKRASQLHFYFIIIVHELFICCEMGMPWWGKCSHWWKLPEKMIFIGYAQYLFSLSIGL